MKRRSQVYTVELQDNTAIRQTQSNIEKTYSEGLEESVKRLRQMEQKEKLQMEQKTNESLSVKSIRQKFSRQQEQMGRKLEDLMKKEQQNKRKTNQIARKKDQLALKLNATQKKLQNEKIRAQEAIQNAQKWKKSFENIKELYNKSQQDVINSKALIQKLKEKNRNSIIDFRNRLTSMEKIHELKQFCTENQIQTLLQKKKLYEEMISSKDNYQGKTLVQYMQQCNDKESDLKKLFLSMEQKEEIYRNQLQTIKKQQEKQNNSIVFFTAQCDKIEANLKNTLNIQDHIIAKVNQLLQQNERLKKQIQSYKNIEEKVKKSELKIQEYSKKMQELISKYIKSYPSSQANMDHLNLYKKSQQKCQQLRKKIKILQIALQQAKQKQYISIEDYKKLQNIVNNSHLQQKIQELLTLRKDELHSDNLENTMKSSTGNIASTFINEERRPLYTKRSIQYRFFECQEEQANNSLINAVEKFQNRSISSITLLFKSSPSVKDNFGEKIISQASLLFVFRLVSSYLGVFSSKLETQQEMFMFTLDQRRSNSINQYFKRQNCQATTNKMRFSENSLIIGENELIVKNNSNEKVLSLNYGVGRQTYFNINPKTMGIEDQITDNKIKYSEFAIYRVYFN